MVAQKHARGKCRTARCKNVAQWRGVCQSCHRELTELVESRQYTDAQLVEIGAWAQMQRPGRPRAGRVVKALERKLARSK